MPITWKDFQLKGTHTMPMRGLALLAFAVAACGPLWADSKCGTFPFKGPFYLLNVTDNNGIKSTELGLLNNSKEPYANGKLSRQTAEEILNALKVDGAALGTGKVTIISLVRWSDAAHSAVKFQKWYVYDPLLTRSGSFYALSEQKLLETTDLPGITDFRLLIIHLNSDPTSSTDEDIGQPRQGDVTTIDLKAPVSYTIEITEQSTQFTQDFKTLLQILGVGGVAPAAANEQAGYWGVQDIHTDCKTSTIKVTPSLQSSSRGSPGNPTSTTKKSADNKTLTEVNPAQAALAATSFKNEGPTQWGLSFAYPVKSYKDVSYDSSSGTVMAKTVTQQSVFATLDYYWPPAIPDLMRVRYLPHLSVGVPIKGVVFDKPMVTLAVGLPWLEVYAGVLFNRHDNATNGSSGRTVTTGTYGIKISVSAVAAALKKTTGSSSQ